MMIKSSRLGQKASLIKHKLCGKVQLHDRAKMMFYVVNQMFKKKKKKITQTGLKKEKETKTEIVCLIFYSKFNFIPSQTIYFYKKIRWQSEYHYAIMMA